MIRIDVYHHADSSMLVELLDATKRIERKQDRMSQQLDSLTAEVARTRTVVDSARALIVGLAAKITEAGTDPAKLAELTASLDASSDDLAAAVAANTPADAPPVDPNAPTTASRTVRR